MNTRTAAIAAAAAALLALTGCSSDTDDSKPAANPKPTPTVHKEAQYLATAREITFNGDPTDAELQGLPPQWCEALDAGHSVQWLFGISDGNLYPSGETWGTVKDDAYKLLIAGVRAYCPTHLSAVQGELRDIGEY